MKIFTQRQLARYLAKETRQTRVNYHLVHPESRVEIPGWTLNFQDAENKLLDFPGYRIEGTVQVLGHVIAWKTGQGRAGGEYKVGIPSFLTVGYIYY